VRRVFACAVEQIAADTMTSSPADVTSYPVSNASTPPSDQACYLLNSTASVQLSYNSYLGATLVFVIVGLVGNTLSVLVFSSAPMRSFSSNVYLLTLAISDSIYLIGYDSLHHAVDSRGFICKSVMVGGTSASSM